MGGECLCKHHLIKGQLWVGEGEGEGEGCAGLRDHVTLLECSHGGEVSVVQRPAKVLHEGHERRIYLPRVVWGDVEYEGGTLPSLQKVLLPEVWGAEGDGTPIPKPPRVGGVEQCEVTLCHCKGVPP